MHALPRVRELHERFADSLSVIGVHAGKYPTERFTDRIAEACDRLGVMHPVVNDRQFRVWKEYAVNAWPTIVVVDPEGYIALVRQGEFSADEVGAEIELIAEKARARGTLVTGADPHPSTLARHEGPLRFPTRAILDDDRLWIADTGHGRVLECLWDAPATAATVIAEHGGFVEPRGLAELGGSLYVADRAGHAIWQLQAGERERMAGTGELGARAVTPGPSALTELRSPWGLASAGGRLAVTMAGTHQLWWLDPEASELALLAGSGGESIADGPPLNALLAQPTGVAVTPDGSLAFADSESSAVRLANDDAVTTVVGTDLFDFGDRDGVGDRVLLQHCEDVAWHSGGLAVADTYNDRLKRVVVPGRECAPWPGAAGEKGQLREPAGVWSDGTTLLAADTGHHRIVVVGGDGSLGEVRLV
jgi:sugar lactone lactonase YvrE